jgi:PQQ-dependent dehydrogenase (methanol/ethanol family)
MTRAGWAPMLIGAIFAVTYPAFAQLTIGNYVSVTDEMLEDPDPKDWMMWRRTLNSWGYSPLDQINRDNISSLGLAWTRGMAEPQGNGFQEGTPLIYDGIMYMPSQGDVIQALDAVTGDFIWEYRRELPDDLTDHLWASATNRNLAIYENLIISTSADEHIFALDTVTGEVVWDTEVHDYRTRPSFQTSGPIIANGKVISGRGCEPKGGPDACVITAHDAKSGEEFWRTHTIQKPGSDNDTWGDLPWEERWHVGAWMIPSYDPELDLIYVGTSVTSPAPKFMLAGNEHNYLYHNSTLALDADTGEIVWYYQHLVDHWDIDHPFERLLVDTAVAPDPSEVRWINPNIDPGEQRKVVTGIPGKSGVVYTLDRETGEFLWATETVGQNMIANINGATGKVTVDPDMMFTKAGQSMLVCPSSSGGKNWQAGAYSPLTNAMYYPLQNTCMDVTAVGEKPTLESLYSIRSDHQLAQGKENLGTIFAISAETGKTLWKHEQRAGTMSLVTTGGGLVFGGDNNGRFRAFDDTSGEVLWEINLGSMVTGYPISYSVDGRQYVAVSTGNALAASANLLLTPELRPSQTTNLFVFALPD